MHHFDGCGGKDSRRQGVSLVQNIARYSSGSRHRYRVKASILEALRNRTWIRILRRANVAPHLAARLAALATDNGTTFHDELLACADIDHIRYFRMISEETGISICENPDPDRFMLDDRHLETILRARRGPKLVPYRMPDSRCVYLVSPAHFDPLELRSFMARQPEIRGRIMMVNPNDLRSALLKRAEPLLLDGARSNLASRRPSLSAHLVATSRQGFFLGIALSILLAALLRSPVPTVLGLHLVASTFFLSCVVLRTLAATRGRICEPNLAFDTVPGQLPTYSVMVALYREVEVVPQLVAALKKLDWPASKLEIILICEEDDTDTLDAITGALHKSNISVLTVPASRPRTKPKALAYALPVVTGEFVAVYDAEDVPHPKQLIEAWQKFTNAGPELACVQAPLLIANGSRNFLTRMFAFEYAALFRGLLPALADRRLLLPLGGTSNHFRTSTLRKVGAWDPFNVTEDADLAIRLFRHGYRIDTIACPTSEDAPEKFSIWLKQRTRWFKGWMQTALVHMRNPGVLLGQLSFASFLVSQTLLLGIVVSSLSHLFILVSLGMIIVKIAGLDQLPPFMTLLLSIDCVNIVLGYAGFLLLGWRVSASPQPREFLKVVAATPVYWLLLSAAAWRALWQLWRMPFRWEKTPHFRSTSCLPAFEPVVQT